MKNKKIAVVGAGGKTTLIHRLAEEYRRKGASVLVTTTTHMLVESDTDLSCDSFAIREKIKRTGYCMAGSLCPGQKQKIGSLPEPVFRDLLIAADYVLIEADGAKHYSLKYPAGHEPVIPAEATDVILVLGAWDLGKSCQDVIFRFDRMAELTGISGKKTVGICFAPGRRQWGIMNKKILIICRGGGDLATGIVHRLFRAGFPVLVLETDSPAAIRRQVSFSEAVYDGTATVEGVTAERIASANRASVNHVLEEGRVPLLVDPEGSSIPLLKPDIVVDAIIAKKNLGTYKEMAPLVIGIGPGFVAGEDVHLVVESMRGHNLARIFTTGSALPNTGIPGNIGGFTKERVLHAEAAGYMKNIRQIGDIVEKGEEIARIYEKMTEDGTFSGSYVSVEASISGIIRGLIREGYHFQKGFKIADIDPRESELANCFTISDKARSIGGSVLEAVCGYVNG